MSFFIFESHENNHWPCLVLHSDSSQLNIEPKNNSNIQIRMRQLFQHPFLLLQFNFLCMIMIINFDGNFTTTLKTSLK